MPALLAVASVAAPGCGDDKEPTTSSTTRATDTTTASTEAIPTTTATDTTTGELPNCGAVEDKATCDTSEGCMWLPELNNCFVDCTQIKDQQTCQMQDLCSWFDEMCELVLE